MSVRQLVLILLPFLLLIILGILIMPDEKPLSPPLPDQQDTLSQSVTFAMVGTDKAVVKETLAPFLAFINRYLESENLFLTPYIFPDNRMARRAISNGEVDFYLDSPFPILLAVREGNLKPLVRHWKDGVAEYHSVILVRKDGPLFRLADLAGGSIAFEDPGSSSSFFLPSVALAQRGFKLVAGDQSAPEPGGRTLRFRFSSWDRISLDWVLEGTVDAAAVSSIFLSELTQEERSRLRVIHESARIPRHVLAVREDLNPAISDAVLDVVLGMDQSPEGREVLKAFHNTRRFDLIPYREELQREMLATLDLVPWPE